MAHSCLRRRLNLHRQDGFTLVDLAMTIAIIGILASIALPNYHNFLARSRQTEAKMALAAVYTAEKSFFLEHSTYTTCLDIAGYTRPAQNNFYAVGFGNAAASCGDGTQDCQMVDFTTGMLCPAGAFPAGAYFASDRTLDTSGMLVTRADFNAAVTTSISISTFTAGAVGHVSLRNGAGNDGWTINENKSLFNPQSGL